jgi:hypothetical protein
VKRMVKSRSVAAISAALFVCLPIAGCASGVTKVNLPDYDRKQVFAAARTILQKRFNGFRELDESRGLLVTDFKEPPSPASNSRFFARVEIAPLGDGAEIAVRVVVETLSFHDMQVVWLDAGRVKGVEETEGMIVEEIRAHLEDREPDLPAGPDATPATEPSGADLRPPGRASKNQS